MTDLIFYRRQKLRKDIVFTSQGIECRGWLYVPDGLKGRAPAIVMANAISAIKEITLPGYAARFEDAGFVVLVFDYRHYGARRRCPIQPDGKYGRPPPPSVVTSPDVGVTVMLASSSSLVTDTSEGFTSL